LSEKLPYLNLGCGARFHPEWINVDIAPQSPEVIRADLSKTIPFESGTFKVVYHAAVLEHMRRESAAFFIGECYRVLEPGGVIRVGVPDLENIARTYLAKLEEVRNGQADKEDDYDWILLELLDQMARERSGGQMLAFLDRSNIPNEGFVIRRIGDEGREIIDLLRRRKLYQPEPPYSDSSSSGSSPASGVPAAMKRLILAQLLTPHEKRALEIGRFRLAGEVHHWMYDRFSLGRLLAKAGFIRVSFHDSTGSNISDWASYHLDVTEQGQAIKPDLIFAEAHKPGGDLG
jgi:predicted SAM-dependent methyltransferase